MTKTPTMDRLTGQLYHLPFIIGQMGLSIANAQKAFDVDYIENVTKILGLIDHILGDADQGQSEKAAAVASLLEALAPARYQFTEATVDFSADLAESLDAAGSAGLGFGAAAVTVNAAMTLGYGYDYRAAARITAKLHAVPANPELGKALVQRAKEIHSEKMDMPALSAVEKEIWDGVAGIYAALTNTQAKKIDAANPGG